MACVFFLLVLAVLSNVDVGNYVSPPPTLLPQGACFFARRLEGLFKNQTRKKPRNVFICLFVYLAPFLVAPNAAAHMYGIPGTTIRVYLCGSVSYLHRLLCIGYTSHAETTQAEFWVVPDRTKDRRESFRALEIKILPPGTLTLEEETHKSLRGTVERAPTFPHRQSFGGGREGNFAVLWSLRGRNFLEMAGSLCHFAVCGVSEGWNFQEISVFCSGGVFRV